MIDTLTHWSRECTLKFKDGNKKNINETVKEKGKNNSINLTDDRGKKEKYIIENK